MRALLDVNVLIALLDRAHIHHSRARHWLETNIEHGWASSAISQNGCVRVLSQPGYPEPVTVAEAIRRMRQATQTDYHEFWRDEISLLDPQHFRSDRIHGHRQITDLYLLALACHHQGRLVTFDHGVATSAVRAAGAESLVLI